MDDPLYAAFGKFMLNYSHAEATLKGVIAHESGVTHEVGRALFSDMRVKPLIDKLRRVHEVKKKTLHPRISEALVHLTEINNMRDRLVHHGFTFEDGQFITSNAHVAPTEKRTWAYPISADELDAMAADLRRIQLYFAFWGLPPFVDGTVEAFVQAAKTLGTEPPLPWLYTPPKPIPEPGMSARTPPESKPQPPTSPE